MHHIVLKQEEKVLEQKEMILRISVVDLIVKAYGAFESDAVYGDKEGIYCQSKIFDTEEFGYQKIVVEQPHRDENGEIVIKKGKPVADISLREYRKCATDRRYQGVFQERSITIRTGSMD